MAGAGIADFQRHFGDIHFALQQQFGGPFHPQAAQILADGLAGFGGKSAAQIEWAAADLLSEFLQREWFCQLLFQKKDDLFHTVVREAILAGARRVRPRRGGRKKNVTASSKTLYRYQSG